jgi:polyisoprenoid-binding protein YceI
MNKNVLFGISILGILFIGGGIWVYNWVLGDTLEASAPIQATPIVLNTQAPTATVGASEPTPTMIALAEATPTETIAADAAINSGMVTLSIVSEESQARFTIFEVLNGQPKDVVGTTNQVAGEVAINPQDLSQIQLGVIQVNARTLATDDSRRNQAIRNRILFTDQYEFITFAPSAITSLSGAGEVGKSYTFQVSGDLTVRDVTQPVTFEITLQAETDSRVSGTASAIIKRSDFNISIPSVPFVADVGEEITLELNFVLAPGGG